MPFVDMPGLPGKLYVPPQAGIIGKKHSCPDCFSCQQCGESRCHVCRGRENGNGTKPIQIQETPPSKA